MELKEKIEVDSIDVNKLFNISSNVSSDFFNNLFKDSIKTIIIKKEKEDPFFIFINLIFNQRIIYLLKLILIFKSHNKHFHFFLYIP